MINKHFYILTGGPGSGKSSILSALAQKGYITVPEVGRQIIQEQVAIGGNAVHTGDRIKFRDLMISKSIEDYLSMQENNTPVFFDRGIPDLIGYSYLINEPVPQAYIEAVKKYRYAPKVFIAPPWEEIYQQDAERKQDFQEAIATYQAISKGYIESGYELIELPKVDIKDRGDFIINMIQRI